MTDRKLKTIFLVSKIFPRKVYSVILLGFECTINPQNLNKSLEPFLRNSKFWIFFLCELPLILGVGGKLRKRLEIFTWGPYIYRIWTRSVDWFRLYVRRRSHRQTDTHTHTHTQTFFLKHIFRIREWYRIENHQKIEIEFFDDCNTSFTPNVARK